MPAYVYLLTHPSHTRFKIGKAVDIPARAAQLGCDQFDFLNSQALVVDTQDAADNLERLLHRVFVQWRLDPAVLVIEEGVRRDGDTEWFDRTCWDRVNAFVETNMDLLQCTVMSGAAVQALIEGAQAPRRPGAGKTEAERAAAQLKEERRRAKELLYQEKLAVTRQRFVEVIDGIPPVLEALAELSNTLVCQNAEQAHVCYLTGTCSQENWADLDDLTKILMDFSLSCDWGAARIFPSSVSERADDGTVRYQLAMARPGRSHRPDIFEEAIFRLTQLPVPIAGWPAAVPQVETEDVLSFFN